MKIYSVNILNGRETVCRDLVLSSTAVKLYIKSKEFRDNFIIIDSWTKRDKKRKIDEEEEKAYLFRSFVYLRGAEIYRSPSLVTLDDLEKIKDDLTKVIHLDGSVTYLPALPMTTPDVQRLIGAEIFTMFVVKDEPHRWATFSIETTQYGLKEKPQLNEAASKMFGKELYGDVLYINEILVS